MPICRDCKLFDLDACRDKAGRVMPNRVGRCLWSDKQAWPESVSSYQKKPSPGYMQPNFVHRCPCFVKVDA